MRLLERGVRPWCVLGLILLLALAVRLHELRAASFWLDEILTVQLSVGRGYAHLDFPQNELIEQVPDLISLREAPPAWRIWTSLDRDVHPPLFYLVLRGWRSVFGDGDATIRMLSVVLSLGAVVMLFVATRTQFGDAAALWAAALMALAGPQIEYAQEMRSYMLLLILLLIAVAAIVRIEQSGVTRWRLIALGAGALGAALTHYAALPALAIFFAYASLRFRGRTRRSTAAAFLAAAAVFAVVWMPWSIQQLRGFGGRIDFTSPQHASAWLTVRQFAELPLRFFTQTPIRPAWIGSVAVLLYLLPALMLRKRREMLLWWMWLVGYVGIVTLLDLIRGTDALQWIRYTLAASPAVYVLAAGMLAHLNGWRRHAVPAALVIACAAALPAAYVRWKADWREMAGIFAAGASSADAIVVQSDGPDDWRARTAYLCVRYYASEPPLPVAFLSGPAADVLARLRDRRHVWLIGGGQDVPAERLLPGWTVTDMNYVPFAGTIARLTRED